MTPTRIPAALLILPLLAGCAAAPLIRIDQAERGRLAAAPLVQTIRYEPDSLALVTPGLDGLGFIGSALAVRTGTRMRQELGLDDPARQVQTRFIESVARELGVKNLLAAQAPAGGTDAPSALATVAASGLVLDFRTTAWAIAFHPDAIDRYRILYTGRARLVRVDDGVVLWQGVCQTGIGEAPAASATYDQLTADNGALLKRQLAQAASLCADDLIAQFFDRQPPRTASK